MKSLPAGLELDDLVSEKVMGVVWDEKRCRTCGWPLRERIEDGCVPENCALRPGPDTPVSQAAPYSKDLALAMKVFDRMRELGHRWLLNADDGGFHLRRVVSVLHDMEKDEKRYTVDKPLGWVSSLQDLPVLICNASIQELEDVRVKETVG